MNELGFGVVSLYTPCLLIPETEYPDSHCSPANTELPVHQDIGPERLEDMVSHLKRLTA